MVRAVSSTKVAGLDLKSQTTKQNAPKTYAFILSMIHEVCFATMLQGFLTIARTTTSKWSAKLWRIATRRRPAPQTKPANAFKIYVRKEFVTIARKTMYALSVNIATGETSPASTPYHTYHFSISTSLTFITSKLPSQDDFHHLITFTTR